MLGNSLIICENAQLILGIDWSLADDLLCNWLIGIDLMGSYGSGFINLGVLLGLDRDIAWNFKRIFKKFVPKKLIFEIFSVGNSTKLKNFLSRSCPIIYHVHTPLGLDFNIKIQFLWASFNLTSWIQLDSNLRFGNFGLINPVHATLAFI